VDGQRPLRAPRKTSLEALFDAQRIAFAPIAFQVARVLREAGVLAALDAAAPRPVDADTLAEQVGLSRYGVTVLLECGLGAGLVSLGDDDRWALTKTGWLVEHDPMTRANMDFVHEVCWKPMFLLEQAIREGRPSGLGELPGGFGASDTVYDALAHLPAKTREAWLRFDHFYSDGAFERALDVVLATAPRRLCDLGANTGRFAQACLRRADDEMTMFLADLPGQLAMAEEALREAGLLARATMHPLDVRTREARLPTDVDAVWMSQFLVCFSIEEIEDIFRKTRDALAPGGSVWVLDTFWDRQRHDIAAYCLVHSSPYFTAVANGNSRMYRAGEIEGAARRAGLVLEGATDGLGLSHSLLRFRAG
jgi:hypothetical protein